MKKKVIIIDYGVGNIQSLKMIFEKLNIDAILTKDEQEISKAKYIILPGVGAFGGAMNARFFICKIRQKKNLAPPERPEIRQ